MTTISSLYDNVVHIGPHQPVIMTVFHQERVMAMTGSDFRVAHVEFIIQQCSDNGARALGRKTPIRGK